MINCKKFCKGGMNTSFGLVAMGLDETEVIPDSKKASTILTPVKKNKSGGYTCPLGCTVVARNATHLAMLEQTTIANHLICQQSFE